MENPEPPPRPKLDVDRLGRGTFLLTIGLIISSWIGVIIGTMGMMGTGMLLPAVAWVVNGFWAVPLFGLTFGAIGLSMAFSSVYRKTDSQELPPEHPVRRMVEKLAAEFHLPPPLVAIYPDRDINAFAAGSSPRKAMVSFSQGLIDQFNAQQLIAVTAHELAHIANRDMRRMQFATSFQKSLTWFASFSYRGQAIFRWLFSTLGELMIMRLSRKREYWADATAAALIGKEAVISCLQKLGADTVEPMPNRQRFAQMMMRPNPASWFDTHPTIGERIAALEAETYMARLPYLVPFGSPPAKPASVIDAPPAHSTSDAERMAP